MIEAKCVRVCVNCRFMFEKNLAKHSSLRTGSR